MTDQLKNILIGLFVAIAITIGISLTLFLEPSVGDGQKILHVRFANVAGISVGTRVTFGGKVVGEVSAIKEVPEARELAVDHSGKVFLYELILKLDSSVLLYTIDEVSIRTTGLMGERSIAIIPKIAPKGTEAVLLTNEVLYANSVDPMENTINQIGKLAVKVQGSIDEFDAWFAQNKDKLSGAVHSLDGTLANMNKISDHIATGSGTIGKIVKSEDLYLRFSSVMGKVETLMSDINHYGVLFQYNKSWQRKRTKRAAAIRSLNTPSDFRSYYEGEVTNIQTSLSRLNEMMSRAEDFEERQKIAQSDSFRRDFSSLLRQVQGLSDSIKLYNEELVANAGGEAD
jgi:phospholipid/cholesterol/gamma-HCH transport system substrate-binding protein